MSEFRKDPASGDWVLIAPERSNRPHEWPKRPKRVPGPKESCPFENLEDTGNWPPILMLEEGESWKVVVIPNKFPALAHHHVCGEIFSRGIYEVTAGIGHHELVIGRDHDKNLAKMSPAEGFTIMRVIQSRYKSLTEDECVQYVTAIFNWGVAGGSSVYHPHYQILSLPIIPPDVEHALEGAREYHKQHKKCVHCAMLAYERKQKKRIILESAGAVALAPFASLNRFEVRIFPKRHEGFFEHASGKDLLAVTELLQEVLRRMATHWSDPDLNFYIHSGPAKRRKANEAYHWHIEIIPRDLIPPAGGFELGTKININPIDPDNVAAMLRGEKIS